MTRKWTKPFYTAQRTCPNIKLSSDVAASGTRWFNWVSWNLSLFSRHLPQMSPDCILIDCTSRMKILAAQMQRLQMQIGGGRQLIAAWLIINTRRSPISDRNKIAGRQLSRTWNRHGWEIARLIWLNDPVTRDRFRCTRARSDPLRRRTVRSLAGNYHDIIGVTATLTRIEERV